MRDFRRGHFFPSLIAPSHGMNNSEDLTLVYVQPLATSFPPLHPLLDLPCLLLAPSGRDGTFHIPQSLRIFAFRAFVRSPSPVVLSRAASLRTISSLTLILCILKCTRKTPCLSFDLSPATVSDTRSPRESHRRALALFASRPLSVLRIRKSFYVNDIGERGRMTS